MQLDRTRIAIRQRTIWEILDLALRVTRIFARPLIGSVLITVIPCAILNAAVLHWIVADELTQSSITRYLNWMILLIYLEAPVATLPATQLMGRVMFMQDTTIRQIFGRLRTVWVPLFLTQGVWRGGILVLVIILSIAGDSDPGGSFYILAFLAIYSSLLRMARPFVNEIIVLERTPIRRSKHKKGRMTLGRRVTLLHSPSTGDLIMRWLAASLATTVLAANMVAIGWFAGSMLTSDWNWGPIFVQCVCPCCLWLAAIYSAVVRFLNYLDLRIRVEGWEVELTVRAAANELQELVA